MVVLAILGVLIAAIFSLYNMQHKMTHIEEDVVDVQQNVRAGIDGISSDLRTAGFLVTAGANPVGALISDAGVNGSDSVTVNTASATGTIARIDADLSANIVAGTPITLTISSSDNVNFFKVGDIVRIISGADKSQPVNTYFTITALVAGPPATISMSPAVSGATTLFKSGYIIARTASSAPDTYPNTIQYCIGPAAACANGVTCTTGQTCLMRIVNNSPGADSVVATNIQNLDFKYILDGSTAEVDVPANNALIRAVRITITGQTVQTAALSGTPKSRQLTTVVKIRNR